MRLGQAAPLQSMSNNSKRKATCDGILSVSAWSCAFSDLGVGNPKAKVMAAALDKAVGSFLVANKNPSRKVKEIDNRGSHYWVARYWADELAKMPADKIAPDLAKVFSASAKELAENEAKILKDMIDCQGS